MSAFVITPETIKAGQLAITFTAKFFDLFRASQYFRVEWTGPNYRKEKFLWWTVSEEGERMTFELRGKPAFCDAILNHIIKNDLVMSNGIVLEREKLNSLLQVGRDSSR
jgi:hypothetical protein